MNLEAASAAAGMEWWNALTEEQRAYWLDVANTAIVGEAWAYLPQTRCAIERGRSFRIERGRAGGMMSEPRTRPKVRANLSDGRTRPINPRLRDNPAPQLRSGSACLVNLSRNY
jgi:hypothetical protein